MQVSTTQLLMAAATLVAALQLNNPTLVLVALSLWNLTNRPQ
ncbi:hypothetical protein [Secundilactobacillus kimchicus]|nr:hypothetical protein [Secundilactobacillus kimchicus]